ncbi:helix-turn-helix transcriptional regulator [Pseudoduganella sp.]|uniref:helix-turn-helix transcriptional regulator n=1 Tax=Pseudoduganella sp. TaxID=1880898 RepID=UPI0035B2C533
MKALFLSLTEVAEVLTLSTATIQELVREKQFPPPRKLSSCRVGWLLREVEAWAEDRPVSDLPPPPNTGSTKAFRKVLKAADEMHAPKASASIQRGVDQTAEQGNRKPSG